MSAQATRFFKDFALLPGSAPGALDTLTPLDARLVPLEGHEGVCPLGSYVRFTGWAAVAAFDGYALPASVFLSIGGRSHLRAWLGIAREDVSRDLRDARIAMCGFSGTRIVEGIAAGRYALTLLVVPQGGTSYYETQLGRSLEIVESRVLFPPVPHDDRIAIATPALEAMHGDGSGNASNRFRQGDILVVRGEAFERDSCATPSRIFAIVDDDRYCEAIAGLANDRGERSAFSVRIATERMRAGRHTVRIAAVASDGASYTLGEPVPFVLRRA